MFVVSYFTILEWVRVILIGDLLTKVMYLNGEYQGKLMEGMRSF